MVVCGVSLKDEDEEWLVDILEGDVLSDTDEDSATVTAGIEKLPLDVPSGKHVTDKAERKRNVRPIQMGNFFCASSWLEGY